MRQILQLAALTLLVGAGQLAHAEEPAPSGSVLSYRIPAGETRVGDSYVSGDSITIEGTQRGDLTAAVGSVQITGTLTGDLQVIGNVIHVDGTVEDSMRALARSVTLNGTVDGDLVVFAESLFLGPRAHVTGKLYAIVRQMTMDGTVDGSVNATGGEISIAGNVGGNVKLRAESVAFTPSATIGGDLDYSSREELAPSAKPVVTGAIHFEPRKVDDDEKKSGRGAGSAFWWLWKVGASLLVGMVGLALFRSVATEIAATVGREWVLALGSGFITFIVVPVVGFLACFLLVTIPLMMLAFVLYVALLYVAKLPVAMWIGGRILRALGRATPSPFACLALGVPLLYLLFEIPVLGFFAEGGALCVGLGAILLGTRQHLRSHRPLIEPA